MISIPCLLLLGLPAFPTISPGEEDSVAALPESIPCIVASDDRLLFLTLGEPEVSVKQGVYHPHEDRVVLADGRVLEHYFRDVLGLGWFEPLNKEHHPLPASGWCSWYYYFDKVTAEETLANARWCAENLKEFGLEYIQLDDGWQYELDDGKPGRKSFWTRPNDKFEMGMDQLAAEIKKLGLKPGIWLSPQGHTDPQVLEQWPDTFLLDETGESTSVGFWGRYILDPSVEESHEYLRALFTTLNEWGYEYYKIDGQPHILDEYRAKRGLMRNPGDPDEYFRAGVQAIRDTIGAERYLMGCWGTVEEGLGLFDGARTGGDVGFNGEWYSVALRATMKYLFLNNIGWYSDPDTLLVRHPLPYRHARLWATLQGLSGQALMLSDRMVDLSAERVELIEKVMPAVDIRPVDLHPHERLKTVWDLKVAHLGREYDVVGVFNFIEPRDYPYFLRWEELGLDPQAKHHVFDFWNGEYLGAWAGGYYVEVAPNDVQVLLVERARTAPQLISTSRHITQGWVDLVSLEAGDNHEIIGESRVIADHAYHLDFAAPPGEDWVARVFECDVPHRIHQHADWVRVSLQPAGTGSVKWKCTFTRTELPVFEIQEQGALSARASNPSQIELQWYQNPPVAGHRVRMDGELVGFTPLNRVVLPIEDTERHTFTVDAVRFDGADVGKPQSLETSVRELLPGRVDLVDLLPTREYLEGPGTLSQRFFLLRRNQRLEYSTPRGRIVMSGEVFSTGIGTHARSEVIYDLKGLFASFTCTAGLNDDSRIGSITFEVHCDGEQRFDSGLVKAGGAPIAIEVDVTNVKELKLIVTDGGDTIDQDFANWADAFLRR